MPQCPQCGTSLKDDDYGMVSCPACSAIVFIDMDGHAHMGVEESANPEVLAPPTSPEPLAPPEPLFASSPVFEPELESTPPSPFSPPIISSTLEEALDSGAGFSGASEPSSEESVSEGFDSVPDFSTPDFGRPDDPLDLNEYANSELSSAKDGLLLFRIFISGIDSKEIRESIREAMDDRRFGWDPAALLSRASKGDLVIDNVTPIKATILISRIKRLPVRIRWEQYAITQMESS